MKTQNKNIVGLTLAARMLREANPEWTFTEQQLRTMAKRRTCPIKAVPVCGVKRRVTYKANFSQLVKYITAIYP